MTKKHYTIGLVSDFNVQNLAGVLQKSSADYPISCHQAPYGQSINFLLQHNADFWADASDAAVVWTLPQIAIPAFQRAASFEEFSVEEALTEVDSFCEVVRCIPEVVRTVILPSWTSPATDRGLGVADLLPNTGLAHLLMRMNLQLAENFACDRRVILLDAQKWLAAGGSEAYSPKLWYLSKTPYSIPVFQEASKDIVAALHGVKGRNKKVIILDLDNTLWGGIVGDIGWEKLRLGGHDPVGEAYVDFQRNLKRLINRGVLLAIASKNEESVALEAIRKHPEMQLRLEDFAAWKINWQDKAANIAELMQDLNLGLDSAVFLDDNPVERDRVKQALPEVTVPDFPSDPLQYASFIAALRCFDSSMISKEDRNRNRMYVDDRQRSTLKAEVKSLDEWLQRLQCCVRVEPLQESNLDRATQLLNKTNQINLSTRRLTSGELMAWAKAPNQYVWTFRVEDRFGEYGLCGMSSLARNGAKAQLVDFILSCRVMGRGVEEAMLAVTSRFAKQLGCSELLAELIPTPKNKPCEKWMQSHPSLCAENNVYHLSTELELSAPSHINVIQS